VNWSKWIRQFHRWMSVLFTVTVIINFIVIARAGYVNWVGQLAVPPLFLLLFSGLYLFALPHVTRWRNARRSASSLARSSDAVAS
jgi:hypothetical protein